MPVAIIDNYGTTISLAMPDERDSVSLEVAGGGALSIQSARPLVIERREAVARVGVSASALGVRGVGRAAVSRVGIRGQAIGSKQVSQAAIVSFFGAGDEGFIYDFADPSALYTDLVRSALVTTDGDPIGSVEDLSGNGNHRSAPTTAARPTYTEINGLAYATMGASGGTRLELDAAISGFTSVNDFTLVVVFTTHSDGSQRPITLGDTGAGDYAYVNSDIAASQYRAFVTTGELTVNNITASDTTGDWKMVTVMKRGTEGLHYVDGVLVETDTGLSATWDADLSTADALSAIRGNGNKIAYIFAIDRGLSDTDLSDLHDFAKAKGGIA